jgi:hypothetical protein
MLRKEKLYNLAGEITKSPNCVKGGLTYEYQRSQGLPIIADAQRHHLLIGGEQGKAERCQYGTDKDKPKFYNNSAVTSGEPESVIRVVIASLLPQDPCTRTFGSTL